MNQLSNKIKRWLTGCLLCFVTACQPAATNEPATSNADRAREQAVFHRIDSISPFIQTGDLITRTGNAQLRGLTGLKSLADTRLKYLHLAFQPQADLASSPKDL